MAEDMVVFQKPEDLCKWLIIRNFDVRLKKYEAMLEISCCVRMRRMACDWVSSKCWNNE